MSEQITEAEPRVSTEGRRRTIARRRIIRCTPRAREMVTMAGSPSGMAATARLTPAMNIWYRGRPRQKPRRVTARQMARQAVTRIFPRRLRRRCSGV